MMSFQSRMVMIYIMKNTRIIHASSLSALKIRDIIMFMMIWITSINLMQNLITGLKHWIMTIRIQKIKRNLRQIKLLIYIKTLTVINGVIC